MNAGATNTDWLDEQDPDIQPGLKCDIEITLEQGDTLRETAAIVAKTLRALAGQIEAGALDTGFHTITSPTGEEVGEVYLDWYGGSL